MEVYTSQPNSEVLKCQNHVVPNLKLHHPHHHLPKIQLNKNSTAATVAGAAGTGAGAAVPTSGASSTDSSSENIPVVVEMKRSYEKTKKEPKSNKGGGHGGGGGGLVTDGGVGNKCSVIRHTGSAAAAAANAAPTKPIISSPCQHNNFKMASRGRNSGRGPLGGGGSSPTLLPPAKPSCTTNGNGSANNNNTATTAAAVVATPELINDNNSTAVEVEAKTSPAVAAASHCASPYTDVFLGGSCNPTTWRTDSAIPLLKSLGISYYNPQVASWCPELISLEHEAKTHAKCLLFVIDNQTRSVVGLIEVAYLAAQGRRVVLVLPNEERQPGQSIMGELISSSEYEELSSAHQLLQQLVERHQIPVFHDLEEAIHCIAKIVRTPSSPAAAATLPSPPHLAKSDITINNESVMEKNLKLIFDSLSESAKTGEIKYSDIPRAYKYLTNLELSHHLPRKVLENLSQLKRSLSGGSCSSSGEDSPPHKKDALNIGSYLLANGGGGGASTTGSTRTAAAASAVTDLINFEEFTFLMTELCNADARVRSSRDSCPLAAAAETAGTGERSNDFVEKIQDTMDKLLDLMAEMNQSQSSPPTNGSSSSSSSSLCSYEVYMSGSLGNSVPFVPSADSVWKSEKAIPLLKKHNISYYTPPESFVSSPSPSTPTAVAAVSRFDPNPIDNSRVLFLYINNSSRAVELMTLASYYIGLNRHEHLVFCIQELADDCQTGEDEKLTKLAIKDYNRGRSYISDIAIRSEVASVYTDLNEALERVVRLCSKQ